MCEQSLTTTVYEQRRSRQATRHGVPYAKRHYHIIMLVLVTQRKGRGAGFGSLYVEVSV